MVLSTIALGCDQFVDKKDAKLLVTRIFKLPDIINLISYACESVMVANYQVGWFTLLLLVT